MPEGSNVEALQALQEAEARHRQILNSAIDTVIISTDLEGRVTSWNEGARRIIGYGEEEMIGRRVDFFFTPEDRESGRLQAEMAEALTHGRSTREGWRVRSNGEYFWASGQMTPLRGESGVTGFVKIVWDRTAEKSAAEALEAMAEQLRMAQAAGGVGTFIIDVANNTLTVTPEFCRLFGVPVRPVIDAEEIERLVLSEDRASGSNLLSRNTGTAQLTTEYRVRRANDGAVRWIARRAEFLRDEQGNVLQMRGVTQDITEQKAAEQTLRESEAQFRTFAQSVPNQVWTAMADGQLEWFNDRVFEYSGRSHEDLASKGWSCILHPDDVSAASAAWEEAVREGTLFETEFRIRRTDGAYRWHLVRALPVMGDAGVVRWLGTNTDIQEQKNAIDHLAQSNETLENEVARHAADRDRMWRLSTNVMIVADFSGQILNVNPAWTQIFGWTEDELVGTRFIDFIHPDDLAATKAEMRRLQRGTTILNFENRYRDKSGQYHILSWMAVPDSGFIHAIGRDITAEKEAALELEQAQEALRHAQKMEAVGQLTGGIAHDFNNLLTGIIGSLDMLQRRMQQGRTIDVERYISAAMTSANRAAALTHRLLAFSRRQPLDPRAVNANRLVTGMEELLRRTIGETIQLEIVTAGGLWQTLCDPHQLENAILNLAINARDAMPGGGTLTIETCNAHLDTSYAARLRDVRPGQYVCICVTDTGYGMTPDVMAKAFDPFFTTKPIGQGTGLGLSMIYGFARQSEGYARIYSEIDKGTTVKLYLPRHYGDAEESEQPSNELTDAHRSHNSETVLVVEDESAVRALVVDVLEELGYRAVEADDGPAGLKLLQSDMRIDLLVTDVGLPGLNGRQLADAARQARPGLKILFMTGYAENAAIAGGFLEPGMEMITKPFAVEALAHRIRSMIDSATRYGL